MTRPFLVLIALAFVFTGCALDRRDRNFLQSRGISGPVYEKMMHHEPLALDDIIELSQKGVPGPFIVHYLRPTYFVYKLGLSDVDHLRKSGVDEGVIHYLAATQAMSPSAAPPWYSEDPRFGGDYRTYPRY